MALLFPGLLFLSPAYDIIADMASDNFYISWNIKCYYMNDIKY